MPKTDTRPVNSDAILRTAMHRQSVEDGLAIRVELDAEHGKEKMRRNTVRTRTNRRAVNQTVKITGSHVKN